MTDELYNLLKKEERELQAKLEGIQELIKSYKPSKAPRKSGYSYMKNRSLTYVPEKTKLQIFDAIQKLIKLEKDCTIISIMEASNKSITTVQNSVKRLLEDNVITKNTKENTKEYFYSVKSKEK